MVLIFKKISMLLLKHNEKKKQFVGGLICLSYLDAEQNRSMKIINYQRENIKLNSFPNQATALLSLNNRL